MKRRIEKRQGRRWHRRTRIAAKRAHDSRIGLIEAGPLLRGSIVALYAGRSWTLRPGERLVTWSRGFSAASRARRGTEPYVVPTSYQGGLRVWGVHGAWIDMVGEVAA